MAITYMTKEGYDKKMKEIAHLESVERPRISAAIAEARDKGDLSENSEYDAAKEAQGMLEMKISQLKDMLANARIIDEANLNTEEVQIMNTVTIKKHQERCYNGIYNRGRLGSEPQRKENRFKHADCKRASRKESGRHSRNQSAAGPNDI